MSRCCWCSGLKEPGNSNSSSSSSNNSSSGKVQERTSRANGCCAPASGCRTSQFSRQCASCVCKEQPVHGQQPRLPQSKPNLKGKASINRPFEGPLAARHRKQFIAALGPLIAQPPPFTIQTNTPTPQGSLLRLTCHLQVPASTCDFSKVSTIAQPNQREEGGEGGVCW